MKIVVIGSNGQLGADIVSEFKRTDKVVELTHLDLNVADDAAVMNVLTYHSPQVVINTAAYHNTDLCEVNRDTAFITNVAGAFYIARWCYMRDAHMVHISTDYVFDGSDSLPYTEYSNPNPVNFYGTTKLASEKIVAATCRKSYIVRVGSLYGSNPCRAKNGLNFPRLMLHLANTKGYVKVVNDEFCTPTYTVDVAKQIRVLLDGLEYGVYHCTNEGRASWYDVAKFIFEKKNITVQLDGTSRTEMTYRTPRPQYAVLENARLKEVNANKMRDWKDALSEYLETL